MDISYEPYKKGKWREPGKHAKPSLFRRIWPKRSNWLGTTQKVQRLPKGFETDRRVLFYPNRTEEYILPNYCPN